MRSKRLKDLCVDIINGGTPSTKEPALWNGDIPWITSADINENFSIEPKKFITQKAKNKVLPANNVLIVTRVGLGKIASNRHPIAFSQDIHGLIVKEGIHVPFLLHALSIQVKKFKDIGRGATIKGVTRQDLETIEILLPDLQTQKQIAQILEDADRARQQRKAANALTEQFLQSSFFHLFGDPVKNDKAWETKKIRDFALSIISGKSVESESRLKLKDEYGVLKVSAVTYGVFKPEEHKAIINGFVPNDSIVAKKGDVLFSRANTKELVAATCIVDKDYPKLFLPDKLWKIKLNRDEVDSWYFKYVLSQPSYRNKLSEKSTGTSGSMFNISKEKLVDFSFPIPPLPLQQHFASIVADAETLRQKQRQSERELEQLFQSLLQKYFGEQVAEDKEILPMAAEPQSTYHSSPASSIPASKKGFAKYILAGKIVKECRGTKDFGHIKFQKLQHLSEYLLEEDLDQNYYYQAAGPYDNQLMHNLANKLSQQGWYREVEYRFIPLEKEAQIDTHFQRYFGEKAGRFRHLIHLLGNASEAQCEIVSTLYAVWNDLLIAKASFTDEDILQRFYDWSDRKSRYTQDQLTKALVWMRENGIVPSGFGPTIKHKKGKP